MNQGKTVYNFNLHIERLTAIPGATASGMDEWVRVAKAAVLLHAPGSLSLDLSHTHTNTLECSVCAVLPVLYTICSRAGSM